MGQPLTDALSRSPQSPGGGGGAPVSARASAHREPATRRHAPRGRLPS